MEVHMSFDKNTWNKMTGKFLEDNMQNQEEKNNIRKIIEGKTNAVQSNLHNLKRPGETVKLKQVKAKKVQYCTGETKQARGT